MHEEPHLDDPLSTVLAWQEAANRQDAAAVLACSAPDIRIVGPRGEAQGHEVLRAWLERAGLTLTTRRLYVHGATVVAEQRGVWRSPTTGAIIGEADVATWFEIAGGRVAFLARYDRLDEALAAAGLSEADGARSIDP
jgi:hypothetical protein